MDTPAVLVKSVVIDGSTVYAAVAFDHVTKPLEGHRATLAELQSAAAAITTRYRRDGFILSRAVVPEQDMSSGVIHLRVVEGFIDKITVTGVSGAEARHVDALMAPVKASRPLRLRVLERAELNVEALPGVTVRTVISPSKTTFGASDLTVVVKRRHVSGYAQIDNQGSRAIGPTEGFAEIDLNSMFGRFDQTSIKVAAAPNNELRYVSLSHSEPLGSSDTLLTLSANTSKAEPGASLSPFQIAGRNDGISATLSTPLVRSLTHSVVIRGSFEGSDARSDTGATKLFDDRLRVIRLGLHYTGSTALGTLPGSNDLDLSLSHGLSGLGASPDNSPDLSRAGAKPDFGKLAFDFVRTQAIAPQFDVALRLTGQRAGGVLPSAEQFTLGGSEIGRGYEPSELAGDHGIGTSLELRYTPPRRGSGLAIAQAFTFLDAGEVWNYAPQPGLPNTSKLTSGGAGLRIALPLSVSLMTDVAVPLDRDIASTHNRHPQFLFVLGRSF